MSDDPTHQELALLSQLFAQILSALALNSAAPPSAEGMLILNCEGDELGPDTPHSPKHFAQRIVIDLAAGRYCLDECRVWMPVKSVEKGRVVLRDHVEAQHSEKLIVERAAGFYALRSYSGVAIRSRTGQCRPQKSR